MRQQALKATRLAYTGRGCLFVLFFLPLLLAGCKRPSQIELIPELQHHSSYFDELKHWHQEKKVYAELQVLFYVQVTYLSPSLKRAYIAELARLYDHSPAEQRELYRKAQDEWSSENVFFVSLFAPGRNSARLNSSEEIWKLRAQFEPSAEEVPPLYVREVSLDDPKIAYFYPYVEDWARHYMIAMPVKADATAVVFKMDGVVGSQQFRWPLEP